MLLPAQSRRRYRRRLLLPPGLLALAWLLWLGCVALPQVRGVRVQNVMEVNFPPLNPDYGIPEEFRNGDYFLPYSSPATIAAFRPWQIFAVTGNLFEDYFALHGAQAVFRRLEIDPNHNRGLQVKLGQRANYSSLVQLLDWCNVYGMKKYWVDIRHETPTLYIFTTKPNPDKLVQSSPLFCGTQYYVGLLDNKITVTPHWAEQFVPLHSPDWRSSTLLLLLLGTVSAYRLGRSWRGR